MQHAHTQSTHALPHRCTRLQAHRIVLIIKPNTAEDSRDRQIQVGHNSFDNKYKGHDCLGHTYTEIARSGLGHNSEGHDYIGCNCIDIFTSSLHSCLAYSLACSCFLAPKLPLVRLQSPSGPDRRPVTAPCMYNSNGKCKVYMSNLCRELFLLSCTSVR